MYVANLTLGLILSIPIFVAFSSATELSGFSSEMAQDLDISLMADLFAESGPLVQIIMAQLLWFIPLLFLWKVASSAGLTHALSATGDRSFWQGVGRYTGKSALLGLFYFGMTIVFLVGVILLVAIVSSMISGEVASFWLQFVFMPLVLFLGVAFIDMMHDFGRAELVIAGKSVKDSWLEGMKWPFRSGDANTIYLGWMFTGVILLLILLMLDLSMTGILIAFIVQQLLLFARALITVGWIGSEVHLFETVRNSMNPTIASDSTNLDSAV